MITKVLQRFSDADCRIRAVGSLRHIRIVLSLWREPYSHQYWALSLDHHGGVLTNAPIVLSGAEKTVQNDQRSVHFLLGARLGNAMFGVGQAKFSSTRIYWYVHAENTNSCDQRSDEHFVFGGTSSNHLTE